jgi:hypothetical protein
VTKVIQILLLILASISFSQSNDNYNYGGGPNSFYQSFQTPRETAMGGTGISSAEGHLAYLWNSACMFNNFKKNYAPNKFSVILGTNSVLENQTLGMGGILSDNFSVGGVLRKEKGENTAWLLGAGILYKNYDNVIETEINVNNEVVFKDYNKNRYNEGMISIFYGNETEDLTIGFSGCYKSSGFYDNRGYGFDLGLLMPSGGFSFIDSSSHGFNIKIDKDNINSQIRYGAGSTFIKKFGNKGSYLSFVIDMNSGSFMNSIIKSGFEYKNNIFFFATGVDYLVEYKMKRSWSIGGGLDIPWKERIVKVALSYSLELKNELSKYFFLVSSPIKISLILTGRENER